MLCRVNTTGMDSVGGRFRKCDRENDGGSVKPNQLIGVSKKFLYRRLRMFNLDRIDISQLIYFYSK